MGKKTIIAILIVLIAILALVVAYSINESPNDENQETLSVSSEGPIPLSAVIKDVETGSYYEGYDNETLNWMKSLGEKSVFSGNGTFVVMSSIDASKLRSEYVTDAYITEEFKCTVLEKHSLGDVKYPKDVLLVKDVEYLGENISYFDV